MKRFSVAQRSLLFLPLLLLTLLATASVGLNDVYNEMMRDRKEMLRELVQVADGVVKSWYKLELAGDLTREQAQQRARDELSGLRFAGNNYFFIQAYDGTTMLHVDRKLEGKNRIETRDPDGVPTVKLMIEAAQKGGGFTSYRNPRDGGTSAAVASAAVPKLSYTAPFAPWNWAVGAGIYIDDVDLTFYRVALRVLLVAGLFLVVGGALCWMIGRSISKPLGVITGRMQQLADGDLNIDVPLLEDRHEMGRLARALEVFKRNRIKAEELAAAHNAEQAAKQKRQQTVERIIADFQGRATQVVDTVAQVAHTVQSHASNLSGMEQQSRARIDVANHAADGTNGNVQMIASAAEELAAAVNAVTQQVTRSTEVAEQSVAEAERTSETMRSLAEASDRIGAIVQVIRDIASQTNLLALNATIEAARAGEAGKGFAVVASEVKTLANQTTQATAEIQEQINGVQAETGRLMEAISGFGRSVVDMRVIATDIAAAMQQQGATTQEIARNIGQAAASTREVSSSVAGVAEGAEATRTSVGELHAASDALLREAKQLGEGMDGFFRNLRAA